MQLSDCLSGSPIAKFGTRFYPHGGCAMVRVRVLIAVSTIFLASCATEQPGGESLAQDLLDCVPKPTLADIWSCAHNKPSSATTPAPAAEAWTPKTS